MSAARFRRAVCREMRAIVAARAERPSYLMDYGPDWPPKPAPPARRRRRRRLNVWQKCGVAVVIFALIWAFGINLLQIVQAVRP